jgi:hypothetical protein
MGSLLDKFLYPSGTSGTGVDVYYPYRLPTGKKHPHKYPATMVILAHIAHKFGPNPMRHY